MEDNYTWIQEYIKKTKKTQFSLCLHALSYDTLLNMVSWNFPSRSTLTLGTNKKVNLGTRVTQGLVYYCEV